MKLRGDVLIVLAGVAVVGALAFAGNVRTAPGPSVYSTYDTGPNGYRALYEVLSASGVRVSRFERVLGTLDPSIRTLVLTGYEEDPHAKPLDDKDAARLRRFVVAGGRLVEIDEELAGSADVAPAVATTVKNAGRDAVPLGRNGYTAGVRRIAGPIGWIFPFRDRSGIPLLANDKGMAAAYYRLGRGEVVAITAPGLFGNARLRDADNLRFAYNAIAGHGEVAFDEYAHGYVDSPTLWNTLPAAVRLAAGIVCLAVVLALIGANLAFAPPYLPNAPDERDSSGYIAAMGELMSRSRARPGDAAVVRDAVSLFQSRKERA